MIKTCKKCKKDFKTDYILNGTKIGSYTRRYCFDCSPVGSSIGRKGPIYSEDGTEKYCKICGSLFKKCRSSYCLKCIAARSRYNRTAEKIKAISYKGGCCQICGYKKSIKALEFHHLDPNLKEKDISGKNAVKFETIKEELDKCALYCANCHREKDEQYGEGKLREIGKRNLKNTYSIDRKTKMCCGCDKIMPVEEFYFCKNQNRFSAKCKDCTKIVERTARRDFKQYFVNMHGGECTICGYKKSLAALEFHHNSKDDKLFAFSGRENKRRKEIFIEEMKKCTLLCANCHREIHDE